MAEKKKELAIMVTTERAVFFGYVDERPTKDTKELWLKRGRCAIYWSASTRGFMGLATKGPDSTCRIGPPVSEFLVNNINSISIVDDVAAAAWETQPWS